MLAHGDGRRRRRGRPRRKWMDEIHEVTGMKLAELRDVTAERKHWKRMVKTVARTRRVDRTRWLIYKMNTCTKSQISRTYTTSDSIDSIARFDIVFRLSLSICWMIFSVNLDQLSQLLGLFEQSAGLKVQLPTSIAVIQVIRVNETQNIIALMGEVSPSTKLIDKQRTFWCLTWCCDACVRQN